MRWRWKRTGAAMLTAPVSPGPLRGDEESGKPNSNNNLDALHRGWRGALVTYIANTLKKRWSVFRFAKPGTWNAKLASREGM